MKTFTIGGEVRVYVYNTVEAESLEEAVEKVKNGEFDNYDWHDEEWVELPEPTSIRDNESGKVIELDKGE